MWCDRALRRGYAEENGRFAIVKLLSKPSYKIHWQRYIIDQVLKVCVCVRVCVIKHFFPESNQPGSQARISLHHHVAPAALGAILSELKAPQRNG